MILAGQARARQGQQRVSSRQPKKLARRVAYFASELRDLLLGAFESNTVPASIADLFISFRETLVPDLSMQQFADTLAQTLSYGLFAARYHQNNEAPFRIDRTHPSENSGQDTSFFMPGFLHKLVVALLTVESSCTPLFTCIDAFVSFLAETNVRAVLAQSHNFSSEDALMHFYEIFLQVYDPHVRAQRGVYYTPGSVVSFMVRAVDHLLRSHFGRPNGLLDYSALRSQAGRDSAEMERGIVLLDPACGTGIFLRGVLDFMYESYRRAGKASAWRQAVQAEILPRLIGTELLVTPYTIAHMELVTRLAALDLPEQERSAWAYILEKDDELRLYLGDTLAGKGLPGGSGISLREKRQDHPILIVFGNPPYAGHSLNKGAWILDLLEAYKEGCPELGKPAQAKWLSDDYVKFLRYGQWNIEQAGHGMLAFITNHSYLDNPTFRGMRRSLMQSFDEIYILDLHGNSKKRERLPDGRKDENVFNIQQGVAISIFVKRGSDKDLSGRKPLSLVYHADVQGTREEKYGWLAEHDIASTPWTIVQPTEPFYLFTPQDTDYLAEYMSGWSVPDIFRPNGDPAPGIVTCHDEFAISWSNEEAVRKVEVLLASQNEDEAREHFHLCAQDQWRYADAKAKLAEGAWRDQLAEILYRPFDVRWTVFNRQVAVHRRERVMRHMLVGENIGLTIGRAGQVVDASRWDIVFCTRHITEFNLYRRGGHNLFPLYLYASGTGTRSINLAPAFLADICARLHLEWMPFERGDLRVTLGPEDIFAYMYAIFHAPAYRARYAPFLKIDFPRLPLTGKQALFSALCEIGYKLMSLHLLDFPISSSVHSPVRRDTLVETVRYVEDAQQGKPGRVYINAEQFFENVPQAVWAFTIGGYPVCKKWLKDRRGRRLSNDEVERYRHIVHALGETVRLMDEIDRVIEMHGGWPIV